MAIRYDNIEFDTIPELMEYKRLKKETKPIFHSPKTKSTLIKKPKRKKSGLIFDKEERQIIIEAYAKFFSSHPKRKRIDVRIIDKLTRQLKRTRKSIISFRRNYQSEIETLIAQRKPKRKYVPTKKTTMIKKKPYVPTEPKLKGTIRPEELEFPNIYPLTERSNLTFENLLVHSIGTNSKINMFDVKNCLQLVDNVEWTGRIWGIFCEQVQHNHSKICTALNCKLSDIRIVRQGKYHYICCGRAS